MPSVGWTDGGTSGYEFEDNKKDFSLISTKFNSNRSLRNFSQNIDSSQNDKDDEDEDIDEKLKKMPTKAEVIYFKLLFCYFPLYKCLPS